MFKLNKITAGMALAGSVAAISALPSIAFAEESLSLEEVTVTARKKVESLQDIAVSVTAVSKQLQNAAVRDIQDVQNYVPNLNIDFGVASANSATISIRGLSAQDPDKSAEAPVGMIVDGVSMGTTAGQMLDNFDLERVEVLRGPQGTLFGKNTTGGALNITRTKPTKELGAKIKVGAASFGARDMRALLNAPVGENGGLKIFAADVKSDGHVYNTTTKRDAGGKDYTQVGAALAFDVTEDFDVLLSVDSLRDKSERGAFANANTAVMPNVPCAIFLAGCMVDDTGSGKDTVSTNNHNTGTVDDDFASLTMNLDLGEWTLTSISAYQDRAETYFYEWDASILPILTLSGNHDYKQKSQELRISGDLNDSISLTAGLYYFESEYRQAQVSYELLDIFIPGMPFPLSQTIDSTGNTESTAVFANLDWNLSENLMLNLGGRYTQDKKTLDAADGPIHPTGVAPAPADFTNPINLSQTWKKFSPRVALQYTVSDDVMVFGSYAQGFKSGGFFARTGFSADVNKYDPETVSTIELGVKSELLDNRVRLNATVFTSDYKDKQEEVIVTKGIADAPTFVKNVGEATMSGVELELTGQITSGLSAYAVAGFLDAKYDKFFADISGDNVATDNAHLKFRNAPEKTLGLGFDYAVPVGFGEVSTNYSYRWSDEYETDAHNNPLGKVAAMGIHNLSLNLNIGENYRISAYGRNLTDERYARMVDIKYTAVNVWNAPRNYGVEFVAEF